MGIVIGNGYDLVACDRCRSVVAKIVHDACHLLHTLCAFKIEIQRGIQIVAVFMVDTVDDIDQRLALLLIICCHLTDQHGRDDSVLISDIGTGKITAALFKAEYKAILFTLLLQTQNDLADIFEACQAVSQFAIMLLADRLNDLGGNDRLDDNGIFGEIAQRLAAL